MNATTNYTGLGPMHAVLDAFTRDAHTHLHTPAPALARTNMLVLRSFVRPFHKKSNFWHLVVQCHC